MYEKEGNNKEISHKMQFLESIWSTGCRWCRPVVDTEHRSTARGRRTKMECLVLVVQLQFNHPHSTTTCSPAWVSMCPWTWRCMDTQQICLTTFNIKWHVHRYGNGATTLLQDASTWSLSWFREKHNNYIATIRFLQLVSDISSTPDVMVIPRRFGFFN